MRIVPALDHRLFLQVEGTPEECNRAIEALTFVDSKAAKSYRDALREGAYVDPPTPTCFYGLDDNRILAGHLPYLIRKMQEIGIEVKAEIPPPPPGEGVCRPLDGLEYRDYQREAIKESIEKRVGIIKISTGGGKTPTIAGIVSSIERPSLILLPQAPLLQQIAGEFHKWGVPDLGVFGTDTAGETLHTLADARLLGRWLKGGTARAKKWLKWLKTIEVLVVDEAQVAPSATWTSIILGCPRAEWRIALSGTPFSSAAGPESIRDFQLMGMFGDIIYEVRTEVLKDLGYIATPEIYVLPVQGGLVRTRTQKSFYSMAQRGREYARVYREGIVQSDARNSLAAQAIFVLAKIHKKKTLVLVQHLDHGTEILRRLLGMGLTAAFVAGDNKVYFDPDRDPEKDKVTDFRSETVSRYIDGEFEVLIASPVFGVGYNLPGESVDAGVILSGGRGHGVTLQRLGRTLRPRLGNKVIIVDFYDNQHFYLSAQSKKRVQEYQTEGHLVLGWKEFSERFL